jgi:hypothetical protein
MPSDELSSRTDPSPLAVAAVEAAEGCPRRDPAACPSKNSRIAAAWKGCWAAEPALFGSRSRLSPGRCPYPFPRPCPYSCPCPCPWPCPYTLCSSFQCTSLSLLRPLSTTTSGSPATSRDPFARPHPADHGIDTVTASLAADTQLKGALAAVPGDGSAGVLAGVPPVAAAVVPEGGFGLLLVP